jgi:predicted nucleotidyltransferase
VPASFRLMKASGQRSCTIYAQQSTRYHHLMTIPKFIDPETESAVRAFIKKVTSQYDFAGAILFGSRARNTFRPDSDADVAVLLHGHDGKFVATKLAMADLAFEVLLDTGIRIQPLPIWEDEWEHPDQYSNPRLLENIAREGVRL